jgi:hypothetical protein
MHRLARRLILVAAATLLAAGTDVCAAGELSGEDQARLLAAYPDQLKGIDGGDLVWRDGTRMPLDDGKGDKPFAEWLERPDIADMFSQPYPAGGAATPPAANTDPGRARNATFFDKAYGDCRAGEVAKSLDTVAWLPKRSKQRLPFNRINGAAQALQAVSAELDELPAAFDVFLVPSAGTYNCRVIAGTDRVSAHGHAIAIDIALKRSHYWRNDLPGKNGALGYRNEIPIEVVRIFEKHGFIWGGRWYHYDTMHFEYRPELLGIHGGSGGG